MNHVAVIVAMTDDCSNLDANIARYIEETGPHGEVILIDATAQGVGRRTDVRVLRRPHGTLVPQLWRDGLNSTEAALVAFTIAAMKPDRGWMTALKQERESSGAAGVGGPIEPADRLSTTDRAVALLRYSGYFRPLPDPSRMAPPGENALYRRDLLVEVESAWADGFWEVAVQKALRTLGHPLAMAETATVTFEGGANLADMARRRLAHARHYAEFRANGVGPWSRIGRLVVTPVVPLLLVARSLAALRARRISITPWLASLPTLLLLATAWAVGEAIGTCGSSRRLSPLVPPPEHMNYRPCKDQS